MSHNSSPTPFISHTSSDASHPTPLISHNLLSRNSSHTPHLTQPSLTHLISHNLLSHNSSHTTFSHNSSHKTQLYQIIACNSSHQHNSPNSSHTHQFSPLKFYNRHDTNLLIIFVLNSCFPNTYSYTFGSIRPLNFCCLNFRKCGILALRLRAMACSLKVVTSLVALSWVRALWYFFPPDLF